MLRISSGVWRGEGSSRKQPSCKCNVCEVNILVGQLLNVNMRAWEHAPTCLIAVDYYDELCWSCHRLYSLGRHFSWTTLLARRRFLLSTWISETLLGVNLDNDFLKHYERDNRMISPKTNRIFLGMFRDKTWCMLLLEKGLKLNIKLVFSKTNKN